MQILGIDISGWNRNIESIRSDKSLNWESMPDSIKFIVIKTVQGSNSIDSMAHNHYDYAVKLPWNPKIGFYIWHDPMIPPSVEFDMFSKFVSDKTFDFIAVDIEQYWEDWNEYDAYIKTGKKVTRVISPSIISNSSQRLCNMLEILNKPVIIYTGASFINERAAPMMNWAFGYPLWYAQYYYSLENISFEKLSMTNFSTTTKPSYPKNYPENMRSPIMWQFSSTATIKNQPGKFDLNLFYENDKVKFNDANTWVISEYVPRKMKVKAWWLTVRAGPSANLGKIRYIYNKTVVYIYKIENNWAKISPDKSEWVNMNYLESA